jgi:signal transduction histidine kinase
MRRLLSDKKTVFFLILLVYIFCYFLGTTAIKSFFIDYKIEEMSPQLSVITSEIVDGNFGFTKNTDFILKAYDVFGVEINVFDKEDQSGFIVKNDEISKSLVRLIPKVTAGNEVALLVKIGNQSVESIVIGAPIVKDQVVKGSAFLLKPASDFKAVLNGFYLIFFVTLVIGVLLIGTFLNLYFKELTSLEQTRKDYIANVSHELKSPVASIKALTETLIDNIIQDEETRTRYYGIILTESSHLQKLISDMLELARIQNGRMNFEKAAFDSKTLLLALYEKYSVVLEDMNNKFEVSEKALQLPELYSDRERILQIFNILIDNASKFIGENGSVIIDAEIYPKHVEFKVTDNGIGIEKEMLPHIFERFCKGEVSQNKNGSGLGLSIAKEIIEGLDEKIWVNSELEAGTTFSFTVRRA